MDIQEKDDDPCRKSAGKFSVDEICLAVVKRCHLPGLPEIDNAWSQCCTSFSVKNVVNDTHLFLPQNYTLPLLMLKWFSERSVFSSTLGWWHHFPGTISCKKGRLGLELSKTSGVCQVLSQTKYWFKKPTPGGTCDKFCLLEGSPDGLVLMGWLE